MNCKNCGGNLSFVNDVYQCDSCGAKFSLQDVYENTDVCICYQENDENGRRTKDSIISQDIYKKLESNKVKTFYARISAGEIAGDDLDKAKNSAIRNAQAVIIVGTTKERFETIYHKDVEPYPGKIIIPVFLDMNPYDIPKNISAIQALDYSKIGADIDLVKGVLNALGRKKEAEQVGVSKEQSKKGKKIIIPIIIAVTVFAVAFFLLYKFTTPQDPQDNTTGQTEAVSATEPETEPPTEPPTEAVVTQADQYESAVSHLENGELADALNLFVELSGYKDSDKQRQLIFDKYSGYYKNDSISLHFQTYNNFGSSIELSYFVDGSFIKISESILLRTGETTFEFTDSENNSGNATIKFTNESVVIAIATTEKKADLSIGDQEMAFALAEKSDKPIIDLDAETILSWVKKPTTIEDLQRMGYEVELGFSSPRFNVYAWYRIKNTDVKLNTLVGGTDITSITVPAEMVIPDHIGEPGKRFFIDNVLVLHPGNGYSIFIEGAWGESDLIEADSEVLLISRESFEAATTGWDVTYENALENGATNMG